MTATTTTERYVRPRINVFEDADAITIEAELPGVAREDAEVEVRDGHLILKAKRRANGATGRYWVHERPTGGYYRAFALGEAMEQTKVEAQMRDGVLKVTLPKVARVKPRTISVN